MARIDQHKGPAQGLAPGKVLLQQGLPFGHNCQRGLSIAIAGKVHQIAFLTQREIVDFLRPPRRVRGARQRLAPGQSIDQARFPNVRAACKAHFAPVCWRQARHSDHAFDEIDRTGKEQAALLAGFKLWLIGQLELHLAHVRLHSSPVATIPPAITVA